MVVLKADVELSAVLLVEGPKVLDFDTHEAAEIPGFCILCEDKRD